MFCPPAASKSKFLFVVVSQFSSSTLGWFSVGICKYKLGYKSHDLLQIQVLSLVENSFLKNIQDLLSSLNAVISTNEMRAMNL
jgi:hypothetical protein